MNTRKAAFPVFACVLVVMLGLILPAQGATIVCTKSPKKCTFTYCAPNESTAATSIDIDIATQSKAKNVLLVFRGSNEGEPLQVEEVELDAIMGEADGKGSVEVELDYICPPSTVADQLLKRQQSLETGSSGNSLPSNWRVFVTTCGTIQTKTKQQLNACQSPIQLLNEVGVIADFTSPVSISAVYTVGCSAQDETIYVESSTTAGMPFHIVRCNAYQDRPFLAIGNDVYINEVPLLIKPAGSKATPAGVPLEESAKYYAGLSCKSVGIKYSTLTSNNKYETKVETVSHQVTVLVTLGSDANSIIFGVEAAEEEGVDFVAYSVLAEAKLQNKRRLSLSL